MTPSRYVFTSRHLKTLHEITKNLYETMTLAVNSAKSLTPVREFTANRRNGLEDESVNPELFYRINLGFHSMEIRPVGRVKYDLVKGLTTCYSLFCVGYRPPLEIRSLIELTEKKPNKFFYTQYSSHFGRYENLNLAIDAFTSLIPHFLCSSKENLL